MGTIAEEFDISRLNPEDVRDKPYWVLSPWTLVAIHLGMLCFGIVWIRWGRGAATLGGVNLPWQMWVWGVWGLLLGAARVVVDEIRPIPEHRLLQCSVAKSRVPRSGDWRHRPIKIVMLVATVSALLLSGRGRSELALGALSLGYMIGTLPSYVYWTRRWRLAWQIIRQVKAREEQ